MTLDEITKTIGKFDTYFRQSGEPLTEKERLFSRVVKLNEEVGELCEAVLYENDQHQRQKEKEIDLDSELADVIICTLLLSYGRQKDIWSEVEKKLNKQLERFNLN